MLTADDTPTIRNAITKRLDAEPGMRTGEITFLPGHGYIEVRVDVALGGPGGLLIKGKFQLPDPFEIGHLHDEIDEIAENSKKARLEFWRNGRVMAGRRELAGTGLRGRWERYG